MREESKVFLVDVMLSSFNFIFFHFDGVYCFVYVRTVSYFALLLSVHCHCSVLNCISCDVTICF